MESICLDTSCGITLIDQKFLEKHTSDLAIQTMGSPVAVRGISAMTTSEYVILTLYLPGTGPDSPAEAKLTHEAHIMNKLKANILVGMDIMEPEKIDISLLSKTAYIGSCKVSILINVRTQPGNRIR